MWWKKQTKREAVAEDAHEDLALVGDAADKVGGGFPTGPPGQGSKLPPGPPN